TLRGLDRLHFAGRRVHAEGRADRGAPDQPGLRGTRLREGRSERASPRHACNGPPVAAARDRQQRAGGETMTEANRPEGPLAIAGTDVRKDFRRENKEVVIALADVSLEVRHGALTALVGPDGAGKTTLIRLIAGLMAPDGGSLSVLDKDVARDPQAVQDRTGYMPQKFGLYEDLSVQENLDLYADLHGVSADARREVYPRLMEMTALGPFTKRLAGRLSGGMKQKPGLPCTRVRSRD